MNDELKELLVSYMTDRYEDASTDVTNGEMHNSLNIKADATHAEQLIEKLIYTKVTYGDKFDIPNTVKALRMDIAENYID